MEIKSNGFFRGRTIELDLYEDIDVFETTENLVLNFLVDNYDFDVNDFNCVPYKFTDIDLDMIVWNYYILYNVTKDKYFFLMSFYDVEDCDEKAVYEDWTKRYCSKHINETHYCRYPGCNNEISNYSSDLYCYKH